MVLVYHVTRNETLPWSLGNKTAKNFWVIPLALLQANIFIFGWVFEVDGQGDLVSWFPLSSFVHSLKIAGFDCVKLTSAAQFNFGCFWQRYQIPIDLNVLSLGTWPQQHHPTFLMLQDGQRALSSGPRMGRNPPTPSPQEFPPVAGAGGWRMPLGPRHHGGRAATAGPCRLPHHPARGSAPPSLHPFGRQLERPALENTISIIGAEQLHQPSWQPGNIFCLNLLRGHIVSSRSSSENPPGASEGPRVAELLAGTRGVTLRGPCPEPGAGVPAAPRVCAHGRGNCPVGDLQARLVAPERALQGKAVLFVGFLDDRIVKGV